MHFQMQTNVANGKRSIAINGSARDKEELEFLIFSLEAMKQLLPEKVDEDAAKRLELMLAEYGPVI